MIQRFRILGTFFLALTATALQAAPPGRPQIDITDYVIHADLDPATGKLTATAAVTFTALDDLNVVTFGLNNPLQVISGFSELLQKDPQIGAQARTDLDLIHQESTRAGAIIRNLSRFGRQRESAPVPVFLGEVISSVIELRQRRLIDQNIRLERDERATQSAHAVFTELQQVALNFVINAEQSVRSRETGDRYIILRTRDDANGVRLEVEDSGPGVGPENEAKLFQPFFTTKPVGEGTGLGLSVSYGIIKSLGGTIGYRRGDKGGALFYFTVPRSTA